MITLLKWRLGFNCYMSSNYEKENPISWRLPICKMIWNILRATSHFLFWILARKQQWLWKYLQFTYGFSISVQKSNCPQKLDKETLFWIIKKEITSPLVHLTECLHMHISKHRKQAGYAWVAEVFESDEWCNLVS
jgi:hypothetical protein